MILIDHFPGKSLLGQRRRKRRPGVSEAIQGCFELLGPKLPWFWQGSGGFTLQTFGQGLFQEFGSGLAGMLGQCGAEQLFGMRSQSHLHGVSIAECRRAGKRKAKSLDESAMRLDTIPKPQA